MGTIVNRPGGADYNQDETPEATPLGATWWQRETDCLAGCNGIVWGGSAPSGVGRGYLQVGWTDAHGINPRIARFNYADETFNDYVSAWSSTQVRGGSFASAEAGYLGGSFAVPSSTIIQKLLFSNEVVSSLSSGVPFGHNNQVGFENDSGEVGYIVSDIENLPPQEIVKLTFSDESTSSVISTFGQQNYGAQASSNLKGYRMCGQLTGSGTTRTGQVSALSFVSEGVSTLASSMPTPRTSWPGAVESVDKGYACGGLSGTPAWTTVCTNLVFSTEATSTMSSGLAAARSYYTSGVHAQEYGYTGGGVQVNAHIDYDYWERITFADDSINTLTTSLPYYSAWLQGFETVRLNA